MDVEHGFELNYQPIKGKEEVIDELKKSACDNIIFTDFVKGGLLEELYSNAYIYVLPSDLEGMPLSLLEAMSYGNCCVTSDIHECKSVIGECGVTFKKGDVGDLKEKLQRLLNDSEAVEKYKSVSSDYVCNRFNWDEVTRRTLELYYGE